MKRCTKCGETKPLQAFRKDRTHHDGHASRCSACRRAPLPVTTPEKRCPKCGETKPREEFYKNPAQPDGLSIYCRPCWKAYTSRKTMKPETLEKRREYARTYYTDEGRARAWLQANPEKAGTYYRNSYLRGNTRRWASKNPEKVAAHMAVQAAVRSGTLRRQPCEACGARKSHAHHEDYASPLVVRWLCRLCHAKRHRELRRLERFTTATMLMQESKRGSPPQS